MIDPKTLAMMQAASNVRSSLRSGKTGQRLLDDAENNVGNATTLNPQELPAGFEFTVQKQPAPPRLLNLTSASKTGQNVTVVMTASRVSGKGVAGPVTGVIEFGNGTQSTRVEFDIPVGPYIGFLAGVADGTTTRRLWSRHPSALWDHQSLRQVRQRLHYSRARRLRIRRSRLTQLPPGKWSLLP